MFTLLKQKWWLDFWGQEAARLYMLYKVFHLNDKEGVSMVL